MHKLRSMRAPICRVADRDLCVGCGACVAVCPQSKLAVVLNERKSAFEVAQVGEAACACAKALCCRVCPSLEGPVAPAAPTTIDAFLLGTVERACLAWAEDRGLRNAASSGGTTRVLLRQALESGLAKRAIFLANDPSAPDRPRFVARSSPDDLSDASNSFYLHTSFDEAMALLRRYDGESSVVVGLPCQILAIRRVYMAGGLKHEPLTLGLYCGGVARLAAWRCFLRWARAGTPARSVRFRGNGWPGSMAIDGRIVFTRRQSSFRLHRLYAACFLGPFHLRRCLRCSDLTAECADLSLADPQIKTSRFLSETVGINLVLVRTAAGARLIAEAEKSGRLRTEALALVDALESQKGENSARKLGLRVWPAQQPIPGTDSTRLTPELGAVIRSCIPSTYERARRHALWNVAAVLRWGWLVFPLDWAESFVRTVLGGVGAALRAVALQVKRRLAAPSGGLPESRV